MGDWPAWLPLLQFWQLELLVIACVVVAALEARPFFGALRAIAPRAWIAAIACSAVALVLTSTLAPRTNRILYDEHIYQHIGQNMADRHRAEMCNDGSVVGGRLECVAAEYNKQPDGYPHLLSVAYRLAGVDERWAWRVNNAAAAALPLVVFALMVLLFRDGRAGALAALATALVPEWLIWGNTAAAEPTAALTGALAVMSAAWFAASGRTRALALAVVATAWACQFRPESWLIVPVAGAIVLTRGGARREARVWWAASAGAILLIPLALHMIAVGGQRWGATGDRVSLEFVPANLAVNGPFYLTNVRFPVAFTVLAVAGLVTWWRRPAAWILAGYFMAFASIYLVFYAGSYDYGADVRYSLLTCPPLLALAGAGASAAASLIRPGWWRLTVPAAMVSACLSFVPLVRAVGEDGWQARADVEAARGFARLVPPGSVVLTHNPSMFLLFGVGAAQMSLAVTDSTYLSRLEARAPGGVYFHENFWCTVADPVQAGFCRDFKLKYPMDLVADRAARNLHYGLYRVR